MKFQSRTNLVGPATDLLKETRQVVLRTMVGVILTSTTVAAAGEVASALGPGIPVNWAAFIERFGITVALLLFFVWRDYKNTRELKTQNAELAQRLQKVEQDRNDELKSLLTQSVTALQASTVATLDVKAAVEHCRRTKG